MHYTYYTHTHTHINQLFFFRPVYGTTNNGAAYGESESQMTSRSPTQQNKFDYRHHCEGWRSAAGRTTVTLMGKGWRTAATEQSRAMSKKMDPPPRPKTLCSLVEASTGSATHPFGG
jgi:hypothetical protein